jgi:crotonobetainyl-CoA:carnitine CoA-transferase CaiB-like acyl-CoA transferase
MIPQALEGIHILDLTHYIAGPFATKLLAGYGADVIKVERPVGGDPARRIGPFFHDEVSQEKSGLFLYLNMNKRGITLNLKEPMGVSIFKELVKQADIVLESFRPGVMAGFGLDYESLEKVNPDLVMVSISNFGQTGPYRDYKLSELVLRGMGDQMISQGRDDREPTKAGETISMYQVGIIGALAAMGGFLGKVFQGIGQHIDISMQEALIIGGPNKKNTCLIAYQYCGEEQPRILSEMSGYPIGPWPCKDGYFSIFGGRAYWDRVVKMLGSPDFLLDPKYSGPAAQSDPVLRDEFVAYFISWSMERTKQEVMQEGQKSRVPCVAVQDIGEVANSPQFNARKAFEELDHPVVGKLTYPTRPFIMSETPAVFVRSAPLLGQHNKEIYGQLGYTEEDMAHLSEWGAI